MNLRSAALILALAAVAPAVASARDEAGRAEPSVSRYEARLLEEVAALAETDLASAVTRLSEAADGDSSAALDFTLGVYMAKAGQLDEAARAHERALAKLPGFVRAWSALGRVLLMDDRPVEAASALTKAIGLSPGDGGLWKLAGYANLLCGRYTVSECAYRQAHVLLPDDEEVRLGLAKVLLLEDRHTEAAPLLKELARRFPLKSEIWCLVANARVASGDERGAAAALETARRLGVLGSEGDLALGDLYYNAGAFDLAAARYVSAASEADGKRILRSAEALHAAGKLEDAERLLELSRGKALGHKSLARAALVEGRIALERGDLDAAAAALEKSVELEPLSGEALLELGSLRRRSGELERASLAYERASRISGYERRALIELARTEVDLGRYARAVEHLEKAQSVSPDPQVGRYLQEVRRLNRSAR